VRGRSLQELRDLILGAPGSNISLTFMRDASPNGPSRTAELYDVRLMRGSPQYLASLAVPATQPISPPTYAGLSAPAASSSPSLSSPPVAAHMSPEQSFTIPIPADVITTPPAPSPAFAQAPVQQPMSQGLLLFCTNVTWSSFCSGFGDEERARLRAALITKESEYKAQVHAVLLVVILVDPFLLMLTITTCWRCQPSVGLVFTSCFVALCLAQVAALQEHVRRARFVTFFYKEAFRIRPCLSYLTRHQREGSSCQQRACSHAC
jgi:hypothetical protein